MSENPEEQLAPRLGGKMGTAALVLSVLAVQAPFGAVAGMMGFVIQAGHGADPPP